MRKLSFASVCFLLLSCAAGDDDSLHIFVQDFHFTHDMDGWEPEFTEYPVGPTTESDSIYEWVATYTGVPGGTDSQGGVLLSCHNLSGDIFMFLKKKVGNLRPNTNYSIVFEISMATNTVAGQALILKAGASELEPKKIIEDGYYSLNIDKGEGLSSGENLYSLGDIGGIAPSAASYVPVTRSNANSQQPVLVKANSKGEIWLIVGTDCQSTGINSVHYSRINVIFSVSG